VKEPSVRAGFIMANGVRLAPEYLVPSLHRWRNLVEYILGKIRSWGGRPPTGYDLGVVTDVFEAEFAADRGIFDLSELVVEEGLD
jgi:hypothetical protein